MRSIHPEVGTYLFATLAARDMESVLPFVRAVIAQLMSPLDAQGVTPSAEEEREIGDRVITLVQTAAEAGVPYAAASQPEAAAMALAADPVMLAAFFQNVDLLYESESPDANAVSATIMRALERLEEQP